MGVFRFSLAIVRGFFVLTGKGFFMLARERMKRWYRWAQAAGIPIKRMLIHPDDAGQVPAKYKGLPIKVMGTDKRNPDATTLN